MGAERIDIDDQNYGKSQPKYNMNTVKLEPQKEVCNHTGTASSRTKNHVHVKICSWLMIIESACFCDEFRLSDTGRSS